MKLGIYNSRDVEIIISKRFNDIVTFDGNPNPGFGTIGIKNGLSSSVFEDIWNVDSSNEVFPSDNIIDTISSSSALDLTPVFIRGYTINNNKLTPQNQVAILQGNSKFPLLVPLARVETMSNVSSVNWNGDIYLYEDTAITAGVPDDDSKIHLKGDAIDNTGIKTSASTSDNEYAVITDVSGYISRTQSTFIDFKLQVAPVGSIFSTRFQWTASSNGNSGDIPLPVPLIIPPNNDFRIIGISGAGNDSVIAGAGLAGAKAIKKNSLG